MLPLHVSRRRCVLIKGCAVADHRAFEVKLFSSPNGASNNDDDFPIRMVLSSYWWQGNSQARPPPPPPAAPYHRAPL